MIDNPYSNAPGYRRWHQAIARTAPAEVDPVIVSPFAITRGDKIVSAGSCFAQHIRRHLVANGFNYLVTETAHPLLSTEVADKFSYGLYSARYGNIYTARQLLQLVRRAFGYFRPADDVWEQNGRYYDPYRPSVQPDGFATATELAFDRRQHLVAVRRAFETMDVFVFTLGLTECWLNMEDGSAYPMCPGTVAGRFEPSRHSFVNLTVAEVVADMRAFTEEVRRVNPDVRIVLTVSPVPLAATAIDRHVLVSTTYSKSVLRVAAEEISRLPRVAYFPAYEIVTGSFSRGRYFGEDLRAVTEEGVSHVMRLFFRHMAPERDKSPTVESVSSSNTGFEHASSVIATVCEEQRLDSSG
jgi:GSCFA family